MADSFGRTARPPYPGVGLLLCLGLLAACGSGRETNSAAALAAPSVPAAETSTVLPSTSVPSPSETTSTTAPDAALVLQQAFDQVATGYHFVTAATVNGASAISAEGDRVNDGTRMQVTSNGATLDYVITPDGTWVNEAGTWSELSGAAPVSDPIASLRSPQSVTATSFGNGVPTQLTASYPPAALSVPGDAPIDVVFVIDGEVLRSLGYTTTSNGSTAEVHSDITALTDTSAVTLP